MRCTSLKKLLTLKSGFKKTEKEVSKRSLLKKSKENDEKTQKNSPVSSPSPTQFTETSEVKTNQLPFFKAVAKSRRSSNFATNKPTKQNWRRKGSPKKQPICYVRRDEGQ